MKRISYVFPLSFVLILLLSACSPTAHIKSSYDPSALRFLGDRALALETEFVQRFPNRNSGQENNQLAAEWLRDEFTRLGLNCTIDKWQVVNYSRQFPLQNVVCKLPGESNQEIVMVAHFDQSPRTVQGADNDGSGIAILIHLAEIFAQEPSRRYTLVFLASDGEEYGGLGSRRYVQTHPDVHQIVAGISLDNLGNNFYNGLVIDSRGQFRSYGPLWLQLMAQDAARAGGDLWSPVIVGPMDQILSQAVPISFVDDGPMIAAGVPALNFGGRVPPEVSQHYWELYHSPQDRIENQSAVSLYQAGRVTEALIRQLLALQTFPRESGPYLYFEASQQVLRGLPLWLIFAVFVALFFVGAGIAARAGMSKGSKGWRGPLLRFLGLWGPLLLSICLLYIFVAVGLMDKYELYPATTKDPALYHPKWAAVTLWLAALAALLWAGRRIVKRILKDSAGFSWARTKSLALLVVGLGGLYVLVINPFSLLFMLPLLFWFLISGRRGGWKLLDVVFFLLGGMIVYVLFYFFGFLVLHINLAVLWFMMMMFSIQMITFPTALVITAILAAGLSLVVNPADGNHQAAISTERG